MKRNITTPIRLALTSALILAQFSACSTTPPQRDPASESTPISKEQAVLLGELGVASLRLSLLTNTITQNAGIQNDLAIQLKEIDQKQKKNMKSIAGIAIGAGSLAAMGATMQMMLDVLANSSSAISGPNNIEPLGNGATSVLVSGLVVGAAGAALLVGESTGSTKSIHSKAPVDKAKAEADQRAIEARAAIDISIDRALKIYANIFSLDATSVLKAKGLINEELIEKSKQAKGETTISVDIPKLLVDNRMITEANYATFEHEIIDLQGALRSEVSVKKFLDSAAYKENVNQLKRIVTEYVEWITAILPGLTGRTLDDANAELARSKLLLERTWSDPKV